MKIIKKTISINGVSKNFYSINGNEFENIEETLKKTFINQDAFYKKMVKGYNKLNEMEKELLGWHSSDCDFYDCVGFQKALNEDFKINKKILLKKKLSHQEFLNEIIKEIAIK